MMSSANFETQALALFRHQAAFNPLYREYIGLLGIDVSEVDSLERIPFLPIQFFKTHAIQTGDWRPELVFSSSGTTGLTTSRHPVREAAFYLENAERCFEAFYGPVERFCFLALLPAYLEREGSSLVYMAGHFIKRSAYRQSGFFLYEQHKLAEVLTDCQERKIPTVLLGVSFALLDLAERHPVHIPDVIVMETGGMKGRRQEVTREELHASLCQAFGVTVIHSEYGMTELFSQAYSSGEGLYRPGPLMRVRTREITDPLSAQQYGRLGAINIIDLANKDSCAFISTDDLGKVYADGAFEVLGRMDNSDIRGCNLMVG